MIPKFKAFINATKQIEDVTLIHFDSRLIKVSTGEWYVFEDIILMQSTGLHDKNGVEIFEGDIVNVDRTFRNPMTGSGTLTLNKNFEVIFVNGMFTREGSIMGIGKDLECITVIGNIYENPGLLEGV